MSSRRAFLGAVSTLALMVAFPALAAVGVDGISSGNAIGAQGPFNAKATAPPGTFPGQASNLVGYNRTPASAPAAFASLNGQIWPGAYSGLTAYPGAGASITISDGTNATSGAGTAANPWIFAFKDFDVGTGTLSININNVIFVGCRFQSNSVGFTNITLPNAFSNVSFIYCSIVPRAALYTSPPGYVWPSAGALTNTVAFTTNVNCIDGNSGYEGGISYGSGGPSTVDHCDFWGFGNAIVCNTGTTNITISDCHFHDPPNNQPQAYHIDGPGYLNGGVPPSNVTVTHCTIAALGNSQNAIAWQQATARYVNMTVQNCYLSGFSVTIDPCHNTTGSTGIVFQNNIISTDLEPLFGFIYQGTGDPSGLFSQNTNKWSGNTLHFISGTTVPGSYTVADDGKFMLPNTTVSTSDFKPKALTYSGATHATGGAISTTVTMNIGAVASPFVVIVVKSSGMGTPSLTVGGVAMTKDVQESSALAVFHGVATGQSGNVLVTLTDSGVFSNEVDFALYYNTGFSWSLRSTATSIGSSLTIAVTAGDCLIGAGTPVANFNSSSVLPGSTRFIDAAGNTCLVGDWEALAATNATFSVADSTLPTAFLIAACYTPT